MKELDEEFMANKKKKDEPQAEQVSSADNPTHSGEEVQVTSDEATQMVQQLKEEIDTLCQEKAQLQDLYLRKQADFDNYRKRMSKEKTESIQYANADLIEKLLDVLDNFSRAKQASQDSSDVSTVMDGIGMIENSLLSLLASKGLTKLNSLNTPFNPEQHLAISMQECNEVSEATVVEEFQPGYLLHDRLLRTAKVKVSMPLAKE
jgi:molecular chaperone GrpE